jgi:DNA-binding NarL/FixJ family response regulator
MRRYRVIRFTKTQVERELDAVLVEIARQCGVKEACDRTSQQTIPRRTRMTKTRRNLSAKSAAVLKLISEGHSYEQILSLHKNLTYLDIFGAAREALDLVEATSATSQQRLAHVRKVHPRAYEKWTDEEDEQLEQLVRSGCPVDDIATQLQRQPSAIRSRMRKRNLV